MYALLHAITSPKTPFDWTDETQLAFGKLKDALTSAPVLGYPDFDKPFVVETDVSSTGVGPVFAQKTDGRLHTVQYVSRTLNRADKNYSACERETLAVVFALRKFRLFLLSDQPFELVTDQHALRYAFS